MRPPRVVVWILATSRERLGVVGEHVHQLPPLPTGPDPDNPAVRLFLERAQGLEGTPSDDDIADIAALCRRLDGLPLAIELGAARAPAFGIREFTAHIAAELDLLAGGWRTAAARHRTLRAVVEPSYELLAPAEALLFERLAVFPEPFRLAQARAVCADERLPAAAVGPVLARLVEQSLVQAADGRFHLLATLRTYAAERLPEPDRRRLRARHARDVADRIAELQWQRRPESEPECVAALSAMTADLHQAWDHAAHHDRGLAVELAAVIYDFAYPRQRLDLCPMCSAAHGWVGLGRIVYICSSRQLAAWLGELGVPAPPVRTLAIQEVVPDVLVEGPFPDLAGQVRDLHRRYYSR